jgi:hypothetical protein
MTKTGAENDCESDPGGSDRYRVDVPGARPAHAVTQSPSLPLEWRQRAPHLVLGASSDSAAPGEGQPVAGTQAEHEGHDHEQRAGQGRTGPHGQQPEHRRGRARQPEAAGMGQPTVLLATRVVHAPSSLAERLNPDHPPMLPPPEDATQPASPGSAVPRTFAPYAGPANVLRMWQGRRAATWGKSRAAMRPK